LVIDVLVCLPYGFTAWVRLFICYGRKGAPRKKSLGRPGKLTKTQKEELADLIDEGPVKTDFDGACWRSPKSGATQFSLPCLVACKFRSRRTIGHL
jgi:hypothetical protein